MEHSTGDHPAADKLAVLVESEVKDEDEVVVEVC